MLARRWNHANDSDVDIRVVLGDEKWAAMGFGDPDTIHQNGKWVAMVTAFSCLGEKMTGLPIDFQLQQNSHANRIDGGKIRSAVGLTPLRMAQLTPKT